MQDYNAVIVNLPIVVVNIHIINSNACLTVVIPVISQGHIEGV